MKFPGPAFCDGKQKLMIIATLPLTIRKVNFDTILVNICKSLAFYAHCDFHENYTKCFGENVIIYTNYEF